MACNRTDERNDAPDIFVAQIGCEPGHLRSRNAVGNRAKQIRIRIARRINPARQIGASAAFAVDSVAWCAIWPKRRSAGNGVRIGGSVRSLRASSHGYEEQDRDAVIHSMRIAAIAPRVKLATFPVRSRKMVTVVTSIRKAFVVLQLVLAAAFAQAPANWGTATEFPGLDQTGLSAQQKHTLLTLIREQNCSCGCTMHIAECRVKDPRCGVSRGLASMVARELREGKTAEAIRADLESRMKQAPPMLDEAVKIPIEGAPVKGPANARITLVEFSDFQ